MKLLVLSRYGVSGASSRLRMFQYLPFLSEHGVHSDVFPLFDDVYLRGFYSSGRRRWVDVVRSYVSRFFHIYGRDRYDVIWIEKELFPWVPYAIEKMLLGVGAPYILDYDDAIFHNYDLNRNSLLRKIYGKKIDRLMQAAAGVVVGNAYLMQRAASAGAFSVLIPTVVDMERYSLEATFENEVFRIGWIGTPATEKYLFAIRDLLMDFCRKRNAEVVLIGARKDSFASDEIKVRDWSEDREIEDICQFDVGIMPLADTPWERGKCAYKLIQYMACGVPVIASPVGANRQVVVHGLNGFLAGTEEEWLDALDSLYCSRELRLKMGKAGKEEVRREYSLEQYAPRLLSFLQQVSS